MPKKKQELLHNPCAWNISRPMTGYVIVVGGGGILMFAGFLGAFAD